MSIALLVVDVQRSLVDELPTARRISLIAVISALIARARASEAKIVYVRHNGAGLEKQTGGWQIASEIAPLSSDMIVDKTYPDSFRDTALHEMLTALSVDKIVVCGMQTEFCIDSTIREGERRGYVVTLVEDGTATYDVYGATEEQIQAQVHRVARGRTAELVPARDLFLS